LEKEKALKEKKELQDDGQKDTQDGEQKDVQDGEQKELQDGEQKDVQDGGQKELQDSEQKESHDDTDRNSQEDSQKELQDDNQTQFQDDEKEELEDEGKQEESNNESEATSTTEQTPTMAAASLNIPIYAISVIDPSGQPAASLGTGVVDQEREKALKEFFEGRLNALIAQAQAADSKAMKLHEQHSQLLLAMSEKERELETVSKQMQEASGLTREAKTELEDTKNNYESQISIMSEEIIRVTEATGRMNLELDTIKGHKVMCGKCKAWNSVEWLITEGKGGQRCIKANHPVSNFML